MKRTHHSSRRTALSYPLSIGERLYSLLVGPTIFVLVVVVLLKLIPFSGTGSGGTISMNMLLTATAATLSRLAIAYALAIVVAIPLALLAVSSALAEKLFLPTFDIIESVPILAFFPIIILLFVKVNFLNGAAIFILFLSMVWNIVFTVVGGLKIIPKDIIYAAKVFHIRGFAFFHKIILPAIFPEAVTGSILAVAQGWNLIIVAEVLHTYLPMSSGASDLFGIGSILVRSAAMGQTDVFIASVAIMILAIAILNFFVWQKLLHYAQRFRFE